MTGHKKWSEIRRKSEMTTEELRMINEDNMIRRAKRHIDDLSRPTYVFRMAHACPDKPGSRERMLNAARVICGIVEDE